MTPHEQKVRAQVEEILRTRFGRVEEQLIRSGILDSLRTIEFALDLEAAFQLQLHHLKVEDTATLTGLTRRLIELGAQ